MDPHKSTLGNIGLATSKVVKAPVKIVTEETGKFSDQATKQISPTPMSEQQTPQQKNATKQEVEGIYGGKEAIMDPTKYKQKKAADQQQTANAIEQILGQLLGPNHKMRDNRKQIEPREHKRVAEELGTPQGGDQQKKLEEEQKKQKEEAEEKRKKDEKKARLENPIEAPAGKQTGFAFKRKGNAPKMQRPPSAETRGGRGNRE